MKLVMTKENKDELVSHLKDAQGKMRGGGYASKVSVQDALDALPSFIEAAIIIAESIETTEQNELLSPEVRRGLL